MARVAPVAHEPADEEIRIGVRLTPTQYREISRRAGLGSFDGKARSAYIVGCLFGEPQEELLERVQRIAAEERARLRAEIAAARRQREQQQREQSHARVQP